MLDELLDVFTRNRSHDGRDRRGRGLGRFLARLQDDDRDERAVRSGAPDDDGDHTRSRRRAEHAGWEGDDSRRGRVRHRREHDAWWDD